MAQNIPVDALGWYIIDGGMEWLEIGGINVVNGSNWKPWSATEP